MGETVTTFNSRPSVDQALRAVARDIDESELPEIKKVEVRIMADGSCVYRLTPKEGDYSPGGVVSLS